MRRLGPIPRTIRDLRAEVRTLRTEVQQLRAENGLLADDMELRERVMEIEKVSRDPIPVMWNLPLTKMKRSLLGILYRTPDIVPRERLRVLLWGVDSETDPKGLDAHICQLRHMVAPHDITIKTIHDVGYWLPPESRLRVAALIERQARIAAAAVKPMNGTNRGEQHAMDS